MASEGYLKLRLYSAGWFGRFLFSALWECSSFKHFVCLNRLWVDQCLPSYKSNTQRCVKILFLLVFVQDESFFSFIKSILKSLVILAIWLALNSAIYSQIALFSTLNLILSSNENGTVKQNNQSDFEVCLTNQSHCRKMKGKKAIAWQIWQQNKMDEFNYFF